jgi:ethanolamine utilization microcompartment shell protein EutS
MKTTFRHLAVALLASFCGSAIPSAHAALGGASGIVIPYAGKLELDGALVTGTINFEFKVLESSTTLVVCQTKEIPDVPVTNGEFAVTIPGVSEACVKGKDVHLQIAVKTPDSNSFVVLGKQRVTPVLGALTSGPGDFAVTDRLTATTAAVTGALTANTAAVTGALTANTAAVTGALSAGATTVTGNLTVSGFALVGFQYLTCNSTRECLCPPDGSTIVFGGVDCGSNAITSSFSASTGDNPLINRWKAGCSGNATPNSITIGCARFR